MVQCWGTATANCLADLFGAVLWHVLAAKPPLFLLNSFRWCRAEWQVPPFFAGSQCCSAGCSCSYRLLFCNFLAVLLVGSLRKHNYWQFSGTGFCRPATSMQPWAISRQFFDYGCGKNATPGNFWALLLVGSLRTRTYPQSPAGLAK